MPLGHQHVKHPRGRAGLVVVVDEVHLHRAAVGRAVAPVVDDVVADIEPAGVAAGLVEPAGQAPVAARAVGQQIVVEAADVAADAGGVAVLLALLVFLWPAMLSASEMSVRCSVMFFAPRELNASSCVQLIEQ